MSRNIKIVETNYNSVLDTVTIHPKFDRVKEIWDPSLYHNRFCYEVIDDLNSAISIYRSENIYPKYDTKNDIGDIEELKSEHMYILHRILNSVNIRKYSKFIYDP